MSAIARPEFLVAAGVVLIAALAAWYFNVYRPRRGSGNVKRSRASAGAGGGGDTRAQVELAADHPRVTFAQVAGLDDAIGELREVRDYLTAPERFSTVGAQLPRGILLYGPPGNGKTLLARALAGETGVPFFFSSAASFVEQYVGLGAARIRELFKQAKENAPSIIFIDELDAVGRKRSGGAPGEREFDHTLNQLLVELDGFAGDSGVLLLGATNRPELLDSALIRPGRFDRSIQIDRPDVKGRAEILRLHASFRPVAGGIDWQRVASQTAGLSGAELANLVNEAALLTARRNHSQITRDDVDEAVSRVLTGGRSARLMNDDEKRLIAYHEAGHALLSLLVRGITPPTRVSILSRATPMGRSPWAPGDDREVLTKRELMAQLIVLLGGRAAERSAFGQPSTRAEDDLDDAAQLARRMVERWAMTGRYELAGRDRQNGGGASGAEEGSGPGVRRMIAQAEKAARTILADHEAQLARVAEGLAEHESLTMSQVASLADVKWWQERDAESTSDGSGPRHLRSVSAAG